MHSVAHDPGDWCSHVLCESASEGAAHCWPNRERFRHHAARVMGPAENPQLFVSTRTSSPYAYVLVRGVSSSKVPLINAPRLHYKVWLLRPFADWESEDGIVHVFIDAAGWE